MCGHSGQTMEVEGKVDRAWKKEATQAGHECEGIVGRAWKEEAK